MFKCSSFLFLVDGTLASTEAEIISTQDEIITYVNHTAKLSCIVQNKNHEHVSKENNQILFNQFHFRLHGLV
jgi:hypothetical protein